MAETTQARRKLIIKLYLPRSETTNGAHSAVDQMSEIERLTKLSAIGTDSTTVSKVCALKNMKGYYAATMWVNVDNPSNSSVAADSRSSITENPSNSSVSADSRSSRTENPSKPHCADSRTENPSKPHCADPRTSRTENPSKTHGADSRTSRTENPSKPHGADSRTENLSKSHGADSRTSRTENLSKPHGADSRTDNPSKPHGADPRNPSKISGVSDSRTSRKGSEECKLKNKRESVGVEANTRMKKRKMQHMIMMNCRRKMQCWTTLKRLMIGRDAWALKQPLLHHNSQAFSKLKLIGLEDIESKLRKLGYSEVDEFAHDIRLVFSYVFGYPPKSEVYRTARKMNESFEVSWKMLKEEWIHEERDKSKKIRPNQHPS